MGHKEIRHKLSEYIDGSLTDEEKLEMEAHLRTCSACSDAYRELQKTIENIKIAEEVEPPTWMTQNIMAKVRSEETERKNVFQKPLLPVFIKIPLQAIAVLFLAVGAFYIYRSIGPTSRTREQPVDLYSTGQHAAGPSLSRSNRAQEAPREEKKSALPSPRVPQSPAYKSLDMKPEYVVPSHPDRWDEKTPASEKAEQEKQTVPSTLMERSAPAPQPEYEQRSRALAGKAKTKEAASAESLANRGETEDVLMKKISDFFSSHDLPLLGNIKYYNVTKFQALPEEVSWLDEGMQKKLSSCKESYQVDVQATGKQLKYFYCADKTSIELLFKVEQKSDRLMKTK